MADYNVGDIVTLQALYKAVLPYMKSHPNMSLYHSDSDSRCNKCGSSNLHNTGMHHYTGSAKYEVWKCGDCQSNVTFKDNLLEKDKRKSLARGVL
jgi:DNA-directed RNA polymerase subunit RPC12/RpoP